MSLIECVPNVSEGRRLEVVAAMSSAIRGVSGVRLLDVSSDPAHNRSVLTIVAGAADLEAAVLTLFARAEVDIDMRRQRGVHPRLGAVDVVPFVPLEGSTMNECVELARRTAERVAERFHVPVYLYEEAARHPDRRSLPDIRRGQFEGLEAKLMQPGWDPDFGPRAPHPTLGASVIGARRLLIAYNVNLSTDRLDVATAVAAAIRQRGGGLPGVRAIGVPLDDRRLVQVSVNITDHTKASLKDVFAAVQAQAARFGVEILESEVVGLVPRAALTGTTPADVRLVGFTPQQVLETRLATVDAEAGPQS